MRLIRAYVRGITRLNDFVGRWVAYLIFLIFLLLIAEVGMRYLLGSPTSWTNEFGQMLFGLYVVLSGGYVLAHRDHVNVDLFYGTLSRRAQACVDIFTSVMFFLFVLALLYFGSSMAWESVQSLETSYSAWNPPIWPIKAAIPLGTLLLLLQGIAKLLDDILIALGHAPAQPFPAHDPQPPQE